MVQDKKKLKSFLSSI